MKSSTFIAFNAVRGLKTFSCSNRENFVCSDDAMKKSFSPGAKSKVWQRRGAEIFYHEKKIGFSHFPRIK